MPFLSYPKPLKMSVNHIGLILFLCLFSAVTLGQPPKFSYSGPQIYTINNAITPLQPSASGSGTFPTTIYGQLKTIAGGGFGTLKDGPLSSATFSHPSVMCADGDDLYFADASGNMVRRLSNGIVSTVAGSATSGHTDGTGALAKFDGISGITAKGGTVYVIEQDYQTIRRISPSGVVTTFAGNGAKGFSNGNATAATFNNPSGIAIDGAGNLYITDRDNYLIRKITSLGSVSTFAGNRVSGSVNGTGAAASFTLPNAIVSDAAGNLFVTDNFKIRKITAQGVVSDYTNSTDDGHVNGPASAAVFHFPFQLALDKDGNLYVQEINDIRKISTQGQVTTLAGNEVSERIDGVGTLASFIGVEGITVSADGSLYVTDYSVTYPSYIRKIDLYGWSVSPKLPLGLTIDNTGSIIGTPKKATPATAYTVTATTATGSESAVVTIATVAAPGIPKISYTVSKSYATGKAIQPLSPQNSGGTILAGLYNQVTDYAGDGYTGSDDGTLKSCNFVFPRGMAFDGENIFIADLDGMIRRILPEGIVGTVVGLSSQSGSGYTDGRGNAVKFNDPIAVATDNSGNIYVADKSNNTIRKIDPTGLVSTIGTRVRGATNGKASVATFSGPSAVACDALGNIFVADQGNALIRKISTTGVVSTFAGSSSGYADGAGTTAKFIGPSGLAFGPNGDLYVIDGLRIRKITPEGVVSTFAGSGVVGSADGAGTSASFNYPAGIAYDQTSSFYLTDNYNLIRRITLDGTVSTLLTIPVYTYKNNVGFPPTTVGAYGIVVDPAGTIYFADAAAKTIRKIGLTGYTISPALPAGLSMDETGTISGTPTVPQATKTYTITAYNANGSSSATIDITIANAPVITSFMPASAGAGAQVTIIGNNFTGATGINFGGIAAASYTVNSATSITAVTASGASGSVTVTALAGTGTLTGFTFIPKPVITSFTPKSSGPSNGITISGSNFTGATAVTLGGTKVNGFTVIDDHTITVTTGSGSTGDVAVTTPGGTTTLGGYTFYTPPAITSFTPNHGAAGAAIVITGSGFTGVNAVQFGNVSAASYTIDSDTQLTAILATGASGKITVVNPGGSITSGPFTFDTAPQISSFTPSTAGANTKVTITGTGFNSTTAVTFGGTAAASFTVNSATSISAVVSSNTGNGSMVTVVTPLGTASVNGFVFVPKPVIIPAGSTTFAIGGSVALAAPAGTGYQYSWYKDNVLIPNQTSASYQAMDAGSYYAVIKVNGYTTQTDAVQITTYFALPASNFKTQASNVTCKGQNNGIISIIAAQSLAYTATVTGGVLNGKTFTFSNQLSIPALTPGIYSVCITVNDQPAWQQCFTLTITEPKDLSLYSAIDPSGKNLVLQMNGGTTYNIVLNGKSYVTTSDYLSIPLNLGSNKLSVSTDKICQGVIEKVINNTGNLMPYPNPFSDVLYVNLGQDIIPAAIIKVYNVTDGRLMLQKQYQNQSGVVQLDVTALDNGVYSFHLLLNNTESIFKISKK
jgi:sugar lactone lactonase YvrE